MRAVILLAAGSSRRYGAANKLMARRGGRPLVVEALDIANRAPAGRVICVTGAQGARVAGALRAAGGRAAARLAIVRAGDHGAGLSASIKAGLRALRPCERALYVFLGDMPAVPPLVAARLARALVPGVDAVRPTHRGRPGHPVLMRRPDADAIARLTGDRGLAPLLGRVATIPAGRGVLLDVDRPRTRWRSPALSRQG